MQLECMLFFLEKVCVFLCGDEVRAEKKCLRNQEMEVSSGWLEICVWNTEEKYGLVTELGKSSMYYRDNNQTPVNC